MFYASTITTKPPKTSETNRHQSSPRNRHPPPSQSSTSSPSSRLYAALCPLLPRLSSFDSLRLAKHRAVPGSRIEDQRTCERRPKSLTYLKCCDLTSCFRHLVAGGSLISLQRFNSDIRLILVVEFNGLILSQSSRTKIFADLHYCLASCQVFWITLDVPHNSQGMRPRAWSKSFGP